MWVCIYVHMCICICLICVHVCIHTSVCISMDMIVEMCMSIHMDMFAFTTKLMDVLIIYLISTYVHGFVFKTYTPLSTFYVFIIVPFTIWSCIIPNSIVTIHLKEVQVIWWRVAQWESILWETGSFDGIIINFHG